MELAKIDPDHTLSQAHPVTMDLLSQTWCSFAVQALKTDAIKERSLVVRENSIEAFENEAKTPSLRMDDGEKFLPAWKSSGIKSWIWMQQAMHPEVNYDSCFTRKQNLWNRLVPLNKVPIKKWLRGVKQRRKEEQRLKKAEVHAAVSIAGVAASLAAMAAENTRTSSGAAREAAAAASAAAMVAAHCAKVAEAMGASRDQLSSAIASAIGGTSTSEILSLTAAAATSIRGVETLKGREGYRSRLKESFLPENRNEAKFDFEKSRSVLARGAELNIETVDGRYRLMSVAIILSKEGKVILRTKKLNILNTFKKQKESVIYASHGEMYKASEAGETDNGYLIVLTTDKGVAKMDMMSDYQRYRTWMMTIDHMLMLSTAFTKYELQFYTD